MCMWMWLCGFTCFCCWLGDGCVHMCVCVWVFLLFALSIPFVTNIVVFFIVVIYSDRKHLSIALFQANTHINTNERCLCAAVCTLFYCSHDIFIYIYERLFIVHLKSDHFVYHTFDLVFSLSLCLSFPYTEQLFARMTITSTQLITSNEYVNGGKKSICFPINTIGWYSVCLDDSFVICHTASWGFRSSITSVTLWSAIQNAFNKR